MADKTLVCLCLDITEGDLERAISEGFADPESLKRYTACFMGPCQGKSCMDTVLQRLAERTGASVDALRRPTMRPPSHPVRLGALAGLGAPDDE